VKISNWMAVRIFLLSLATCFCAGAHAGFFTGAVVGSAVAGSKNPTVPKGEFIASEKHDVIACEQDRARPNLCAPVSTTAKTLNLTPQEYAGYLGYGQVYKRGVYIQDGRVYIIMEVGR